MKTNTNNTIIRYWIELGQKGNLRLKTPIYRLDSEAIKSAPTAHYAQTSKQYPIYRSDSEAIKSAPATH